MVIIGTVAYLMFRKRLVWPLAFIGMLFTACQTTVATTTTSTRVLPTVEMRKSDAQAVPTVTIMEATLTLPPSPTQEDVLTSMPTPMQIEIAAITETATPMIVPPVIQKIGEIPVSGHRLAVSSDGTTVATMNNNSVVLSVFDMVQQKIKWQYEKDGYGFTTLSMSPDGNLLAGGGTEQQVLVFNAATGNLIYDLPVPYIKIERASFSSDSQLLAVSSIESDFDAGIMVWDMETGRLVDTLSSQTVIAYLQSNEGDRVLGAFWEWYVGEVVFVPNQTNLLVLTLNIYSQEEGEQGGVYFWDIGSQELTKVLMNSPDDRTIAVSPNGQLVLAVMGEQLGAWNIQNHTQVSELSIPAIEIVRMVLTDAGNIAMLDRQGDVTIWNLRNELIAKLETENKIVDIAFMPEGYLLVAYFVAGNDVPLEIWHISE